jgi:hypothetical protein
MREKNTKVEKEGSRREVGKRGFSPFFLLSPPLQHLDTLR